MKKYPHCKALTHGFSLLELSIVLAVIGLLVGGVVSMRSYTKNAQLTTLMNEAKFYMSAFSQFQTRYNAPPGDYSTASSAWTGAGDGDGNGIIRANNSSPSGNTAEWWYAWQHLALGGFIPGTYTGAANSNGGATAGVNVPASSMEGGAYVFDHPNAVDGIVTSDAFYPPGTYSNVLIAGGLNTNAATRPDQSFLTASQAYQLDSKYDDGIPYTGNIRVPYDTFCTTPSGPFAGSPRIYASTAKNGMKCYLILQMP